MNKILLIAVALVVVAAVWLYNRPPRPPNAPVDQVPSRQAGASPDNVAAVDPGPTLSIGGNIATETFDDGTETVLGIRVRKDRNCRVELRDYVTTDGEMFSAYSCTPVEGRDEHPYVHYGNDTLETLAYADAEAAALLGQRLAGEDADRSYRLLVRATALDGDTRHLAWLADVAYSPYRVDGELQVDNVMRQYELAALASHLGEDPENSLFLRDELLRAGVGNEEIDRLDVRVDELIDVVRDIQLTVYGEIRYGGQNDA